METKKPFLQVVDLGGNAKPYGGYVNDDGYLCVKYEFREDTITNKIFGDGPECYYKVGGELVKFEYIDTKHNKFREIAERSLNHQSLTNFVYTHRYIFALAYSLLLVGIGLGLK